MASAKVRAACIKALERDGTITAQRLLKAATNPDHLMNEDFEWDDTKCGKKYRLNQARGYIAAVRITHTTTTMRLTGVAYVRDPRLPPEEQGYVSTIKLRSEREVAEDALAAEMARLQSILERTREIAALLNLTNEHEDTLQSVLRLNSRIRKGPSSGSDDRLYA